MKIQASVTAMLKLQRSSTYKDTTTFLDELTQNGQRAGATEVHIEIDEQNREVTVFNNGSVLEDMQVLFSMGDSGWGEKTKSENPFGIGFFSNVSVSDDITVLSGNKKVHFDVKKAIEDGILDLDQEETQETVKGFQIILKNFDNDKCPFVSLREKAKLLGEYVQSLSVFVDGQEVAKKDLTLTDGSLYSTKISNENVKGWISIQPEFFSSLKVFYKGRYVTDLSDMWYVSGELHIEDGVLNLTAPDRKDIIKDNSYFSFYRSIHEAIKKYASAIAVNAKDIHDEYADSISYWADFQETYDQVLFTVFCGAEQSHMDAINKLVTRTHKEDQVEKKFGAMDSDAEAFIDTTEELAENEVSVELELQEPVKERSHYSSSSSYSKSKSNNEIKDEMKKESLEDTLQSLIGQELVFWIGHDELTKHENKLSLVKHYALNVVVSANKVQDRYLKVLEQNRSNVHHISNLKETIYATATLANTVLSPSEKRAAYILSMISRILGQKESLFRIGDLTLRSRVEVSCTDITVNLEEQNVVAFADVNSKKVMLDRNLINCSSLKDKESSQLGLEDYKFILGNIHDILKQVNLLSSNLGDSMNLPADMLKSITHGLAFN